MNKEETIEKWKASGLLEGLDADVMKNVVQLFENQSKYVINETGDTITYFEGDIHFPIIRFGLDLKREDDEKT